MSITNALNNAASGLTANARMAEVVSSNLSNALTDGYGRRSVELSARQLTGGVQIDGITRSADRGIIGDRRLADSALAGSQRETQALQNLMRTFGDVGDPASFAGRITALEQSLIAAANDPSSDNRLTAVVSRLGEVTQTLKTQTVAIQDGRVQADTVISRDVSDLNTSLKQIERLNADISRLRGSGIDTSSVLDARQQAIDKIAAIVPLREMDRGNGQIALITTSGETLIDGKAAQFSFQKTATITADMTFASGALSGILKNGVPIGVSDGFGGLSGGGLAASFRVRDQTLVALQSGLDAVAADLVQRFADPATDPTLVPGDPGLLTDRGAALAAVPREGLAGRLQLNSNVDPAQGGASWRLRDGVQATTQGQIGRSGQLNAWINAIQNPTSSISGAPVRSVAGHVSTLEETFGMIRIDAEQQSAFTSARWETLRTAELSMGVDTDQELQQLLRIEQSYAANAKVIQTIDFMMQRLMEI